MVNAHLDTLELELRKLDGVRTVGFTSQHDVLYIQLFVDADAPAAALPFEATRIAQRHSSSPVAVELVRWTNLVTTPAAQQGHGSMFTSTNGNMSENNDQYASATRAGSIGTVSAPVFQGQPAETSISKPSEADYDDSQDIREEPTDFVDMSQAETFEEFVESSDEVNLADEEAKEAEVSEPIVHIAYSQDQADERREDVSFERIALLLVTTSAENDEIEVHLSFDELRTIGRAATNRGLLGAIDATVEAIAELTGSHEFHAEWARSLEPGAEHASLVAVGLTNSGGSDTRHGIAGGTSPIEAAARATLNALNRTAVLAAAEN